MSVPLTAACPACADQNIAAHPRMMSRVSTRVVVVVVVVVAQPDCLPKLVRMSQAVTEPKSHSSLPKHLPLHTEVTWKGSSSDKLYSSVFSGITGQVGGILVKLTEKAKTHSAAAQWLLQSVAPLRSGPQFWFRMNSLELHRKAKTAIKSTKATRITISYKHRMLIYKEK